MFNDWKTTELITIYDALHAYGDSQKGSRFENGLLTRVCDELKARGCKMDVVTRRWVEPEED